MKPKKSRVTQDAAQLAPNEPPKGVICEQYVRCGRANCRCSQGQLHGPYYYRFWRENGRLKKEYVKCQGQNQQQINDALQQRQQKQAAREERSTQMDEDWKESLLIMKKFVQQARETEKSVLNAKQMARHTETIREAKDLCRRMKVTGFPKKPGKRKKPTG